jgi:hypothetical protein
MEMIFGIILALFALAILVIMIVWLAQCVYLIFKIIYILITYRKPAENPISQATIGTDSATTIVSAKPKTEKVSFIKGLFRLPEPF